MNPIVTTVRLNGDKRADLPLLVLGPSLGTSAHTLWHLCAEQLANDFDVVAWDLPGHGTNQHVEGLHDDGFTIGGLTASLLSSIEIVLADRGEPGGTFAYAGDSVGGMVGIQLALDAPNQLSGAALLCTGARIGTPDSWADRIARVRAAGTASLVTASAERWFGPQFLESHPDRGSALLHALQAAHDDGYIATCAAISWFDVTQRLDEISVPILAIAGADDQATPPELLRELADGVQHGTYAELAGVAHLAPIERPTEVADLLREFFAGSPSIGSPTEADPVYEAGMQVRRAVLGDDHVDRAVSNTTDLTADFQDFITRYAWGSVWTRPGLDRRSRSMITITALLAHGHDEELAMHLRAARRNGLTWEEIREVLLHASVYCGVPGSNTAFRIAQEIHDEESD